MLRISGIYVLYFDKEDNQYYIGKSVNIHKRYSDHVTALKNGTHHNYKIQNLYNKYGEPPVEEVLEIESDYTLLSAKEIIWINEFDSYNNGLNLTKGGDTVGQGSEHPGALYTKDVYSDILYELAYSDTSISEVSTYLGVSTSVVKNIAKGATHTYLSTLHPEAYNIMLNKLGKRTTALYDKDLCTCIVKLLANNVLTMYQIAEETGAPISLVKGIAGGTYHKDIAKDIPDEYAQMISLLGTRTCGPKYGGTYPDIISPNGVIYKVHNAMQFSKEHGLNNSCLSALLSGKAKTHKGWRRHPA